MRVIAHSLGALVVGNALWDASGVFTPEVLDSDSVNRAYTARVSGGDSTAYHFPAHRDVRVGLLAPATSSLIFARYSNAPGRAADLGRLVVGLNPEDEVTNKRFGLPGFAGATTLGARVEEFCWNVRVRYSATLGGTARLVNMHEPTRSRGRNADHSWITYSDRAALPRFQDLLFTPNPAATGDEVRECRTP